MDQTSMSTMSPDDLSPISGHVDPPPPPPPPHPSVRQPSLAPQRQEVGPEQPAAPYRPEALQYDTAPAQQIQILPLVGYLPDGRAVFLLSAPTNTVKTELTEPTESIGLKTEITAVKIEATGVKTKKPARQQRDGPYVKKPPNAFMLFMREQRPSYADEMKSSGSAVVNGLLGRKWSSLSKHEQAKYYELADAEKRRHARLHPDWNPANNYGVKRKRDRSKAARAAKRTAASTSGGVAQQDRKPRVASAGEAPQAAYADLESFWLDFNELAEVKELKLTVETMHDAPAPPESDGECDDDEDLLELAAAVEVLLAALQEPDLEVWSYSDVCRFR
ncbi:transcription factor 7-like 1 [Clinocottus analis]|uniref:transcription factor 7-like 1 n=1 Tax=Clinocottus analis TaxID=304258 RepID=UPI0035C20C7E